jgi:hypothetical protein
MKTSAPRSCGPPPPPSRLNVPSTVTPAMNRSSVLHRCKSTCQAMLGMSPKEGGQTLDEGEWMFAKTGPAAALSNQRTGELSPSGRATIAVVGESGGGCGMTLSAARDVVPAKTDAIRIPNLARSDPR